MGAQDEEIKQSQEKSVEKRVRFNLSNLSKKKRKKVAKKAPSTLKPMINETQKLMNESQDLTKSGDEQKKIFVPKVQIPMFSAARIRDEDSSDLD